MMCTEKSVKLSVHLFMDVSQTSSIYSVQKVAGLLRQLASARVGSCQLVSLGFVCRSLRISMYAPENYQEPMRYCMFLTKLCRSDASVNKSQVVDTYSIYAHTKVYVCKTGRFVKKLCHIIFLLFVFVR